MKLHRKNLNMDNKTFIQTYDNAIPDSLCDDLIQKFESNKDQWENRSKLSSERSLSFNEIHLFKYTDTWKDESKVLQEIFTKYIDDYKKLYSEYCFPNEYGLEPFKMKKYDSNGVDEFGWHVDVNSRGSMHRWLGFFLYLSDNEEGKTEFPYQNTITDCKKGSMVVFPPMWPWFHRGTKPIKEPKYFMGSYLLYV